MSTTVDINLIFNRIKEHYDLKNDAELSRFLEVPRTTLSSWKSRSTTNWELLFAKCVDMDFDELIKGESKDPPKGSRVLEIVEKADAIELPAAFQQKKGTIPITDINVAAGSGYLNQDYIDELDSIVLPERMMASGRHLCVRVKGNSMAPTLHDSGYVIIRLIGKGDWQLIPNEHVYVISDNEGRAFLKRVKNRFKKGFITLMSDNPDKATYPNFNLQSEEINTIWHVEWYISAKMPNIHDQYYARLQSLENRLDDMEHKLLRKN